MAQYPARVSAAKRTKFALIAALLFLAGIIIGATYLAPGPESTIIYQKNPQQKILFEEHRAIMRLPAVTRNDTGVFAQVAVTARPGEGKIRMNINNVLSAPEVEQSARMAVLVASNYTGISAENTDFTYDLYADASLLEGPSAGASFTAATIAALTNRTINQKTMMTGTINHDGTIGPAGKILEKAQAAKSGGATMLIVPVGASTEINYTASEFCRVWGNSEYCQEEIKTQVLDISQEAGIDVVEVRTIDDALKYLLA